MTDQPRLLDAYRRAHEAANPVPRPEPSTVPTDATEPPWTMMAGYLLLRGWEYQVRCGRRIWKKEDEDVIGGFRGWYSEEMAYLFVEREERHE